MALTKTSEKDIAETKKLSELLCNLNLVYALFPKQPYENEKNLRLRQDDNYQQKPAHNNL